MTICKVTGMACDCQPDEGVECTGEQTLREGFHGWRNAALKAEARVRELEALPAAPASQAPAVVPSDEQIEEIWDRVADELTQEQKMVPMFARALLALVGVTKEPEQRGHPNARSGQFTDAADGGWQPIETAPKDGTSVLVAHDAPGSVHPREAYYVLPEHRYPNEPTHAGWWRLAGSSEGQVHGRTPTHWMPLPKAPAGGSGSGSDR